MLSAYRDQSLGSKSQPFHLKYTGTAVNVVLFSISLDLLQLIARGHCGFPTVKECCYALCKESAPVLQPSQVHNQEKLAILEGIELQHAK
jgi:hypothetical protein